MVCIHSANLEEILDRTTSQGMVFALPERRIGFVSAAALRETEDVLDRSGGFGRDQGKLSEGRWAEILDRSQFFLDFRFLFAYSVGR